MKKFYEETDWNGPFATTRMDDYDYSDYDDNGLSSFSPSSSFDEASAEVQPCEVVTWAMWKEESGTIGRPEEGDGCSALVSVDEDDNGVIESSRCEVPETKYEICVSREDADPGKKAPEEDTNLPYISSGIEESLGSDRGNTEALERDVVREITAESIKDLDAIDLGDAHFTGDQVDGHCRETENEKGKQSQGSIEFDYSKNVDKVEILLRKPFEEDDKAKNPTVWDKFGVGEHEINVHATSDNSGCQREIQHSEYEGAKKTPDIGIGESYEKALSGGAHCLETGADDKEPASADDHNDKSPERSSNVSDDEKTSPQQATGRNQNKSIPSIKKGKVSRLSDVFLTLIFSISIFGQIPGIGGTLTVKPKHSLVLSGADVRLGCSTDFGKPVYWDRILTGADSQQTIYYGKIGMATIAGSRFSVDEDQATGRYDLVIRNAQPEDAGKYICIDESGVGKTSTAELVILEYFRCDMPMPHNGFMGENIFHIPENEIRATCRLKFRGNMVPDFLWSLDNTTQAIASQFSNGSTAWSMVTLRGIKEMNGARLGCRAIFSGESSPPENGPHWTSDKMAVRYVTYQLGSVATCQGSTMIPVCNPSCYYQEQTSETQCHCVAIYYAEGTTYNMTFNEYQCDVLVSGVGQTSLYIIAGVLVPTFVAAVIAVIAVAIKLRIKAARNDKSESRQFLQKPSDQQTTCQETKG